MENRSPNQEALRRLRKNKPAMFGFWFVVLTIVIAILGYVITPDGTPDVNDQIPTLALKNMGFRADLLKIRKNRAIKTNSFFVKMMVGSPNEFELLPIKKYVVQSDSVFIEKYLGEDPKTGEILGGGQIRLHAADVLFDVNSEIIKKENNVFEFTNANGEKEIKKIENIELAIQQQVVSRTFWFGTDNFGRDILSRMVLGVRVSLFVGLIAVLISLTIGVILGALAGFVGGRTDDVIMLLINTIWSIPTILLVFAIVLAFGKSIGIIFLAVGLTMWVDVARMVRGQVLSLKEMQFIEATKVLGFDRWRTIFRHVLPNVLGPVMVMAASNFATAILIESGLSYLGFGIQPPTPSWGTMLNENYGYAIGGKPFLAMIPAIAILLMVLAFNLLGNGFRDALDVKSKE
jgi:peptide/nickel transport system permease protein